MRVKAGIYLEKNKALWKDAWTKNEKDTVETERGPVPNTAEEFLQAVKRQGRWMLNAHAVGWCEGIGG